MPISEYRKIQLEQRELDRKLDEIIERRARERKRRNRLSYCMHTPKEALLNLGNRNRNKTWY